MDNKNRLRFRAFHKPTKKMFEVFCFTDKEVFENTIDGVGATPTNPANIDDCVLVQCTGLKDKNGTLIYEGDILATSNKDDSLGCDLWEPEDWGYTTICWDSKNLCFTGDNWFVDENGSESVYEQQYVSVVGNIHETPELLEDK